MRTEAELKTIAIDLFHNKIFTSQQVKNPNLLTTIFIPLSFMPQKKMDELQRTVAVVYEYCDKAGSFGINGYPTFNSFKTLTVEEWSIIMKYYDKLKAAEAAALSL